MRVNRAKYCSSSSSCSSSSPDLGWEWWGAVWVLDQMWESEEEEFGLQYREERKMDFYRKEHKQSRADLCCMFCWSRRSEFSFICTWSHWFWHPACITLTWAILEDIVGLGLNEGHPVIERTQVRRRKQHPEKQDDRKETLSHFHRCVILQNILISHQCLIVEHLDLRRLSWKVLNLLLAGFVIQLFLWLDLHTGIWNGG